MERAEALEALRGWLVTGALVGREDVRQVLEAVGYVEEAAGDYPGVLLFYRRGWPRWTLMAKNPSVDVEYRKQIATRLITLVEEEEKRK